MTSPPLRRHVTGARSPWGRPRALPELRANPPTAAAGGGDGVRGIVGEDDGGKLMSPQEYADYKRRVLPQRERNRLFVSWSGPTGIDCKLVGPETRCFCTHRYKQHQTDLEEIPKERPIHLPCLVHGCRCASYLYIPSNGSQAIRCHCKHPANEHREYEPYVCKKCAVCKGFQSSFSCGCGYPTLAHQMVVETKEERVDRGKPVGHDVPYAAMGGLTGFSSLAEGYLRLDESGVGVPGDGLLNAPITAHDHPFLRAHSGTAASLLPHNSSRSTADAGAKNSLTQGITNLKVREEEDMAELEKRYQERMKLQRQQARTGANGRAPSQAKTQSRGKGKQATPSGK
uniref:Protein FAM221A n=1 Tax=Petromyzon marinus TaxID=7757 RepID=A0AAJ7SMJ6_PETMA|nr:protein FAM221A isoform X1 [Petromyzon marinus]